LFKKLLINANMVTSNTNNIIKYANITIHQVVIY